MSKRLAVSVLRWTVALVSALGAARLLMGLGFHRLLSMPLNVMRIICLVELLGAALFVIPRTGRLAGILLLVAYIAAGVAHLLHGEYDVGMLVVLGAAVCVILTEK